MKKLHTYFSLLPAASAAIAFLPFSSNILGSPVTTHVHPSNSQQRSQLLYSFEDDTSIAQETETKGSTSRISEPSQGQSLMHLSLPKKEPSPITVSTSRDKSVPLDHTLQQMENSDKKPPLHDQGGILINFSNVDIVELIRYISKFSNKNFYFNEQDLNFQVTIISEEPTTIENVVMALMQELRIHDFNLLEQGDNIIIHSNGNVRAPGMVKAESLPDTMSHNADIVTQVFRLNTANATSVSAMIKPMLSTTAILEVLADTNHIILTDVNSNVQKIATLMKSIDAPNSSLIIGQYVVRNAFMNTLMQNAELIMQSVAPGQAITFVPHTPSNSIFIVSTPFLVERAIPILQRLDQTDGLTGIYSLNDLKYTAGKQKQEPKHEKGKGKWHLDSHGNWLYQPDEEALKASHEAQGKTWKIDINQPPEGYWKQDSSGNWAFTPGANSAANTGPRGSWEIGADQKWNYKLTMGESIYADKKAFFGSPEEGLPFGQAEKTKFLIHKLNYRLGESIQMAIMKIAESMRVNPDSNQNLLATISSVQWLQPSNSLIFTGTPDSLLKVKELVEEIDQPLRQVFIEMLIMDTTITDSLNYSVNWGDKFRGDGGNSAGAQAFQSDASVVSAVIAGAQETVVGTLPSTKPIISNQSGYAGGIIGQTICAGGLEFSTLGAFVRAVHSKTDAKIVLNPKIITEDNVTAELFVGVNTQFQTQSISNDQGSIITNNFEFRDVGTTLKVTPLLGPSNIITLQIEEEVSSIISAGSQSGLSQISPGPTTAISRTMTQVHIPDKYFLVISGMIQDEVDRTRQHVPCLGGAPLIGAAFTGKAYTNDKRCLMIFIRPQLIDTEEQIDNLTKHQQNIHRLKSRTKRMWKLDCEEALDWMNLKEVDPLNDENRCCDFKL